MKVEFDIADMWRGHDSRFLHEWNVASSIMSDLKCGHESRT
jgi:hypothetical protein